MSEGEGEDFAAWVLLPGLEIKKALASCIFIRNVHMKTSEKPDLRLRAHVRAYWRDYPATVRRRHHSL
jgi:hypothetical protein